jgi:hypothetical protein
MFWSVLPSTAQNDMFSFPYIKPLYRAAIPQAHQKTHIAAEHTFTHTTTTFPTPRQLAPYDFLRLLS